METLRLRRGLQLMVEGRNIGIIVMNPDAADPAARVGVGAPVDGSAPDSGHVAELRVGDQLKVGDAVLRTTGVVIGDDGYVVFDIASQPAGDPR